MASEKLIDLFKRLEGKFQLKQLTYNQLSRGINSIFYRYSWFGWKDFRLPTSKEFVKGRVCIKVLEHGY